MNKQDLIKRAADHLMHGSMYFDQDGNKLYTESELDWVLVQDLMSEEPKFNGNKELLRKCLEGRIIEPPTGAG